MKTKPKFSLAPSAALFPLTLSLAVLACGDADPLFDEQEGSDAPDEAPALLPWSADAPTLVPEVDDSGEAYGPEQGGALDRIVSVQSEGDSVRVVATPGEELLASLPTAVQVRMRWTSGSNQLLVIVYDAQDHVISGSALQFGSSWSYADAEASHRATFPMDGSDLLCLPGAICVTEPCPCTDIWQLPGPTHLEFGQWPGESRLAGSAGTSAFGVTFELDEQGQALGVAPALTYEFADASADHLDATWSVWTDSRELVVALRQLDAPQAPAPAWCDALGGLDQILAPFEDLFCCQGGICNNCALPGPHNPAPGCG